MDWFLYGNVLRHERVKIKELKFACRFPFQNVSPKDVKKVTWELEISKNSQLIDNSTKIIK